MHSFLHDIEASTRQIRSDSDLNVSGQNNRMPEGFRTGKEYTYVSSLAQKKRKHCH
jgi:hypothetical protein